MATIDVSTVGRSCGSIGVLDDVYSLDEYDPDADYTIKQRTGGIDPQSGVPMTLDVPVRSIGFRHGGRYFFAPDLRFVAYPGFDRVFPAEVNLSLEIDDLSKQVGGRRGFVGLLSFDELVIYSTNPQASEDDALEKLKAWATRNAHSFTMPAFD